MSAKTLVTELIDKGVKFDINGDKLRVKILPELVTPEIDQFLRNNKPEIIEVLKELKKEASLSSARFNLQNTIPVVEKKAVYKISSAQRRMYFLYEFDKNSLSYNMPYVLRLEGTIDKKKLQSAFEKLLERHESLRTVFTRIDGEVYQKILPTVDLAIEYATSDETQVDQLSKAFVYPFDLQRGPLLRVKLITLAVGKQLLLMDMHHIITDGFSQGILIRDLIAFYTGQGLPDISIQYKDYAEWQQSPSEQGSIVEQKEYWKKQFSEFNVLDLPTDYPRPLLKNKEGGFFQFWLDEYQTERLQQMSSDHGATIFMTLLSVFNVALSKLSNQEDLVIGTPIAGRMNSDLEGILGLFVNTLALRNYPKGEMSFTAFLQSVRNTCLDAFDHQKLQYEDLIDMLNIERNANRNPLFDVMFVMQNFEKSTINIPGIQITLQQKDHSVSEFDLSLMATESEGKLFMGFQYSRELFSAATIESYATHFKTVVDQVITNPEQPLREISLLTKTQETELWSGFDDFTTAYPKDQSLITLFEQQVNKLPEKVAVIDGEKRTSYRELSDSINKLAVCLSNQLPENEAFVGIYTKKSTEAIIAMLAILKVGRAYLPLDVDLPAARLDHLLQDSNTTLILANTAFPQAELGEDYKIVDINEAINPDIELELTTFKAGAPNDLAYVMYTSGTTGKPKGVLVEQQSVVRLVKNSNFVHLTESDGLLSLSNYHFDGSVFDIYGALLNGATLVIPDATQSFDVGRLTEISEKEEISVAFITTALFNSLVDLEFTGFRSLRCLMFGGEMVSVPHVRQFKGTYDKVQLLHVYGPTENTTFSTYYEVNDINDSMGTIPIGMPIANSTAYILDNYGNIQPTGVVGEIYLGGDGLSRGYLNDPELTTRKFVDHPFHPGKKLYRSGDFGKRLADGNIEFVGRNDDLVKVRGFRISLNEIEVQLLTYSWVREALVVVIDHVQEEKSIVAYCVTAQDITSNAIKESLASELPGYMVPNYIIQLDQFPLNKNGKVDRKALPLPEVQLDMGMVAPRNELEEHLQGIWSDILRLDPTQISVTANFFDLGGHSLRAMTLVNRIAKDLGVKVPLKTVFSHYSIASLASLISTHQKTDFTRISPTVTKPKYLLSAAQKRLYFLYEVDRSALTYNMPQAVKLKGNLEVERLEGALKRLIERHDSLRTTFEMTDDEVYQRVHQKTDFSLQLLEVGDTGVEHVVESFMRPFDLHTGPLFRAGLVPLAGKEHVLLIDMHHIISDGISQGVLIRDFFSLYNETDLPGIELQYKDYAEWQNSDDEQAVLAQEKDFWLKEFSGEITALELPWDFERPLVSDHSGDAVYFALSEKETDSIRRIASGEGATLFMTLLSVFNIVLSKLSNQEDIVVGTPVAGRVHPDLDEMIGLFVNTLALRNYPVGSLSFQEFLNEVKQNTINCFDHQKYQYEDLVNQLNIRRDTARNPLFDVMFALQEFDKESYRISELEMEPYSMNSDVSKFDLTLTAAQSPKQLHFTLRYATSLFKKETIKRFLDYFKTVAAQIAATPEIKLNEITLLGKDEEHRLLHAFNATRRVYPDEETLPQLFQKQVSNTSDNIALFHNNEKYTYAQLNEKVIAISAYLHQKGVRKGQVVGLMLGPSVEQIAGIISIMKMGGVYLPLDASLPVNRLAFMLEESDAEYLLTDQQGVDLLDSGSIETIVVSLAFEAEWGSEVGRPDVSSSDPAYIIYTSGSTGQPKGVQVNHRSVVNLIDHQRDFFNIDQSDRILQFSVITFDTSIEQIWMALLSGAGLVLVDKSLITDHDQFVEYLIRQEVTYFHATPSFLGSLDIPKPNAIKRVVSGGEVCPVSLARRYASDYKFYNKYGPTETTVTATTYEVSESDFTRTQLPIGKPISNTGIYILDTNLKPVPTGVAGDLYIGGDGLSNGYINNQSLTSAYFIPHPFKAGERIYKTGDLAKWDQNGDILFLGRSDRQVKIRGYRIELGEIEACLRNHTSIVEAAVLLKEVGSDSYLTCYYSTSKKISEEQLRDYLKNSLPEYMFPHYFVSMDHFPLTTSGKVDRNALPEPVIISTDEYQAPSNEIERKLVKIWSKVLGIKKEEIGVRHSFFDLGGHSLKAMTLVNKIKMEMGVSVPLMQIFNFQDIESLARFLSTQEKVQYSGIKKAPKSSYYKVSAAQRRMYFLYEFEKDSTAYNMPQVARFEGDLNKDQLIFAFNKLIQRHESLRTGFQLKEGEVFQFVSAEPQFEVVFYEAESPDVSTIIKEFVRPFDLAEPSLFRVGLIPLNEQENVLMLDMHHIISDGVSTSILKQDFMNLYKGLDLAPMSIQYKDYSEWQQSSEEWQDLEIHKQFWLNEFAELPTVLQLPYDHARPTMRNFRGGLAKFVLSKEETAGLQNLASQENATMFMTLLAIFNVLLAKLSNQEDIVVGTPVAGRVHPALEKIIGLFVNTLAIRSYPSSELSFKAFLQQIRERTIQCFEYQQYQYEDLVDSLNISRNTSHSPLFDVMFSMQNFSSGKLEIPGLKLSSISSDHRVAKFDLTLTAVEAEDQLYFSFEYSTELFEKSTIDKFIRYYQHLVRAVVDNADQKLYDLPILSKEEQSQLLLKFNNTTQPYTEEQTLVQVFEEKAKERDGDVALIYYDQTLTYGELNSRANRLAQILIGRGVNRGAVVGLMVDRSFEMIISILATLKAGAAVLPIDVDHPEGRISYMLDNSKVNMLVVNDADYQSPEGYTGEILNLFDLSFNQDEVTENISLKTASTDLLYVIYTSGSTGIPKGVMMRHYSMWNLIDFQFKGTNISFDRVLQFTTLSFDVSLQEIFSTLLAGGELTLVDKVDILDFNKLFEIVNRNKISTIFMPASILKQIFNNPDITLDIPSSVKHIVTAGEQIIIGEKFKKYLSDHQIYLHNHYGPAETHVVTTNTVDPATDIPTKPHIGQPIYNTGIYILGKKREILPLGVPGEIYISGKSVGGGYINNPSFTEERFVDNPYDKDEKLYKTGDVAKWLPDGSLEFLGRQDDQIKIRGFRVELGEIESQLATHKQVIEAVVMAKGEGQNAYLVAYYVAESELDTGELRSHLGEKLPEYMLPTFFVFMQRFPLNQSGKVDRKALPDPSVAQEVNDLPPTGEVQEKLAEIWSGILKIEQSRISANKSFFDLGGNSLSTMILANKIWKELNVEMPIKEIFLKQTIEQQADLIEAVLQMRTKDLDDSATIELSI